MHAFRDNCGQMCFTSNPLMHPILHKLAVNYQKHSCVLWLGSG